MSPDEGGDEGDGVSPDAMASEPVTDADESDQAIEVSQSEEGAAAGDAITESAVVEEAAAEPAVVEDASDEPAAIELTEPKLRAQATQDQKASDLTSIKGARIAGIGNKAYTGKAIKPRPKVTLSGKTLVRGTDYTISYKNNKKVGTATIAIRGKGEYCGTKKVSFKIVRATLAKATVSKVGTKRYTGKVIKPRPKVVLAGRTLKRGTDYTLSYKNNKKVGKATIIVKGKGSYRGCTSTTFKIAKKKSARGPTSAGALAVKGSQLVDKNGKAIQLRGVSTHGLAWFPDYVNGACFKELRNTWGANVVRLAMYTEEYGGYCAGGSKKELKALVKKGVRLATKNDLYVIVDWHILADGNPLTHVKEAKAFFKDLSATFKGNNNVIYEICNEPNGGTTWAQIKRYAKQVIPVIRKNDPDAVILVGTPTWSQEIDKALASPLSYDNVMYTMHFYASTHGNDLRNRLVDAVRGGLPVFVSEFGVCEASGNGSIDKASANAWMSTMNKLKVSWCMWSLCNKDESAAIIKSSCTATSGFKKGDLSASGSWLLKALDGTLPAGKVATGSGARASAADVSYAFTSGSFACVATRTGSWDAGGGKTCYQFDLSITNMGTACTSWKVTVPFNKTVTLSNGWCGVFTASGSKLVVKNESYNAAIAKGATVAGIGFQVTAASGLAIK